MAIGFERRLVETGSLRNSETALFRQVLAELWRDYIVNSFSCNVSSLAYSEVERARRRRLSLEMVKGDWLVMKRYQNAAQTCHLPNLPVSRSRG